MGLGIYLLPSTDSVVSQDADLTNPFSVTFDGRSGGVKEVRLYIRNDDAVLYYSSITLKPRDLSGDPIVDRASDGFVWKLSEGDVQPTQSDWNNISPANTISFVDIGAPLTPDTSTYLPFWVYVQVPPGLDVQTFNQVQLVMQGEESLI